MLQKLKVEEVRRAVVIIPDWPTAHWFPPILEMVINRPLLLPQWQTLLILPQSGQLHPLRKSLRLAAWNLSGVDWKVKEFLQGQPHTSWESWRAGTGKQYSAAWSCFIGWGKQRTRDPVQATVGTLCDFLSDQFGEGKSYSTVNSYRSALSGILVPVNGRPIGEHPLIVRLLKGMFNVRPPVPRYNGTWDVNIVLKFLENWHPLETLEMKHLSFKTVALVGLVSAQRSQALAALTLKDMSVAEDGTRFCVSSLLTTSRPGKSSTSIMVPKNTSNGRLCPHTTLQTYISRTESVRNSIGTDSIFISLCSPFKAVGSSSLSRWLKTVLSLAGIDSSVYTGHSFRSAFTSKASRLGVPLDTILSTADWKNSGTFFK